MSVANVHEHAVYRDVRVVAEQNDASVHIGTKLSDLVDPRAAGSEFDWATRAHVDRWLGARGFLAVLTLRLVPLVPFYAANYAAGVTAIRLRDFAAGTAVGIVPGVVVYTILGARASDPTGPVFLLAVAGLVVLAALGTLAARRLRTPADDDPEPDPTTPDRTAVGSPS